MLQGQPIEYMLPPSKLSDFLSDEFSNENLFNLYLRELNA